MKKVYPLSICIRKRPLASGDESLFFDISRNGKRWKESLHLNLYKGSSREVKLTNKTTLEKAERLLVKRQEELENEINGLPQKADYLREFFPYFEKCANVREHKTKLTWDHTEEHLKIYAKDEHIAFADITPEFCQGFSDYLKNDALNLQVRNFEGRKIGTTTANNYYCMFAACLNQALKDGVIVRNPAANVMRPKRAETEREFLSKEELALLFANPYKNPLVSRVFLFACCVGLRYSDIKRLKWKDIRSVGGRDVIYLTQEKTDRIVSIPLNNTAKRLIGERGDETEFVFDKLPVNNCLNKLIGYWMKKVGITKHISIHCARHTFAINLLDGGVDIYTTSKLLGHTDLKTTQIYAKVLDKNKTSAVDALDNLLKV